MTLTIKMLSQQRLEINQLRWLKWLLRSIPIGLGVGYTWAAALSHSMNADGVSYLDVGDAFWKGEWAIGLSSVWSPLYAWLLGLVMHVIAPPMHWEFPVVHIFNFLTFIFALVCFEFFWQQLLIFHRSQFLESDDKLALFGWPDWAFWSVGFLLFTSATLTLIKVWSVTPDMLMAAFIFLAAGLLVKIRLNGRHWYIFLLMGCVLGLGYLTKAIMMPVSILFLGVTFFTIDNFRAAVGGIATIALGYLIVILPYLLIFASIRGDLPTGGVASFTYAKHVNGIPDAHWQGLQVGNGTPLHPTRQIFNSPPIYEFSTPIAGTYPISFDPSYWNAGLEIHFDGRQQLEALILSGLYYLDLFFYQYGILFVSVFLLYLLGGQRIRGPFEIIKRWSLVVIALSVFGFYGIVLVSGRYIGVFVILFWADLLANIHLSDSTWARKLMIILSGLMIIFLNVNLLAFSLSGYRDFDNTSSVTSSVGGVLPTWPGEVAETLLDLGIQAGDPVAIIGYGFDSFWARLAHVRIVAEMPISAAEPFWVADADLQADVIQAFASSGAKAIVAETVPTYAPLPNWQQVGNSNYFIYLFP